MKNRILQNSGASGWVSYQMFLLAYMYPFFSLFQFAPSGQELEIHCSSLCNPSLESDKRSKQLVTHGRSMGLIFIINIVANITILLQTHHPNCRRLGLPRTGSPSGRHVGLAAKVIVGEASIMTQRVRQPTCNAGIHAAPLQPSSRLMHLRRQWKMAMWETQMELLTLDLHLPPTRFCSHLGHELVLDETLSLNLSL